MLKIKELRFRGIGRFVENQVIHFDSLGSLIQVDGKNMNTGGSSGAGKTTVFNALDYLFGINDLPITVLQSRGTENTISVSGNFDWDGVNVWITRSKSRGLSIEIMESTVSGSAKITEEKLDQIIGMPRDLFKKILHKRQKEGGFFLQLTPKDTYNFLISCLGLSDLNAKLAKVDLKIKELTEKHTLYTSSLASSNSALKATQDAILSLGVAPSEVLDVTVVVGLKERLSIATSALDVLRTRHSLELQTLDNERPQLAKSNFDRSEILRLEADIQLIYKEIYAVEELERERQSLVKNSILEILKQQSAIEFAVRDGKIAESEAPIVALEIKKIRESLCPTCDQSWNNEASQVKESKLLLQLKNLKDKIEAGKKGRQDLVNIQLEITRLADESHPKVPESLIELTTKRDGFTEALSQQRSQENDFNNAQHYINKIKLDEFARKQIELRTRQGSELNQAVGEVDVHRRNLETIVQKIRSNDEAKKRYETSFTTLKKQENDYQAKVFQFGLLESATKEELEIAEEAKKAIKNYASRSFDEALDTIADSATRLIRSIPNMANATIQLDSTKETKEGKVKEEVNAVISMDGELGIPIKSLSGGERTSIDLAVDLAVIDLIESKTGKGINIFILDEPFEGLEAVNIEMVLDVLRLSSENKKIVIVAHDPIVKQMVESGITVVREGLTSRIER